MEITIKKIAEIAGVSRGTVDRALNGRPGVNKEVAQKIMDIANELGYRPNLVAKALAGKKTYKKKIGVILNADDNPFYTDVIKGVNAKAREIRDFGFEIILKTTKGYDVAQQIAMIRDILLEQVDGLIISPIDDPKIAQALNGLSERNIPLITINTDIANVEKICYVGSDYEEAGHVAAALFGMSWRDAKKKVGIITGSRLVLGHNLRIKGFKACIAEAFPGIEVVGIKENNDNDILSYKVTRELLSEHPDLDGVFFCAAGIEGGIVAVEEHRVDKKIDIVTVDLIEVVKNNLEKGTIMATICQEPYKQGFESIKVMFENLMEGKKITGEIIKAETQIKLKYNIM